MLVEQSWLQQVLDWDSANTEPKVLGLSKAQAWAEPEAGLDPCFLHLHLLIPSSFTNISLYSGLIKYFVTGVGFT